LVVLARRFIDGVDGLCQVLEAFQDLIEGSGNRGWVKDVVFRADAAFARPGIYEALLQVVVRRDANSVLTPRSSRLVLPKQIEGWSLTSLQQRLVKTGRRLIKHAR